MYFSDPTPAPHEPPLYFDAWTEIGPRARKHREESWSLEHLRSEMEQCSISGALVADTQTVHYDPLFANLRLSRLLEGDPRLYACWNLLPPGTGEFPEPEPLAGLLREHDVRAVAIHPRSNSWDFLSPLHQPFFERLAREGRPVFLARSEIGGYDELERFLRACPGLPVVLTGAVWSEQRFVLPLLRAFSHLHLTFERFQVHCGLERLVADGLEDQLLYGSQAPLRSMGAHRAYVDYADIPESARKKIAGGNLRRLLNGAGPSAALVNRSEDAFMHAARHGRPIEHIDLHMHVLDTGLNGGGGWYRMEQGDGPGILRLLRRLGCVGGGLMSWNGTVGCDAVEGNRCTAAALESFPETFWGLATLDPSHYSRSELECQMEAVYRDPRFIGMKPYFHYGVPYHDASYDPWWQYGNRRGFYALLHRVLPDFSEVASLAARYPAVRWVVAHSASDFATAEMAIACAREFPNVYLEITYTPTLRGIIEFLARGAGEERVLYGSDLPMRDPRQQFGWVVFSSLSARAKRKILFENALKVVGPSFAPAARLASPDL
ncbi:MAG TPA: amidohydrolase family protein [Chthoniobacteraceae bacterium]|nr:amidohydrolase family protein [Chthoniobacteraceae bacterium]